MKQSLTITKSGVTTWITPLSYDILIVAYLFLLHLLEVGILDVLRLWTLLGLLLAALELVATRLACCAALWYICCEAVCQAAFRAAIAVSIAATSPAL